MDNTDKVSEFLKAMADPTRLKLMRLMLQAPNPLCVSALAYKLGITQSAVSQHLRILRQLDLVTNKRVSPHIHYEVNKATLKDYQEQFSELIKG